MAQQRSHLYLRLCSIYLKPKIKFPFSFDSAAHDAIAIDENVIQSHTNVSTWLIYR